MLYSYIILSGQCAKGFMGLRAVFTRTRKCIYNNIYYNKIIFIFIRIVFSEEKKITSKNKFCFHVRFFFSPKLGRRNTFIFYFVRKKKKNVQVLFHPYLMKIIYHTKSYPLNPGTYP